MHKGVTARVSSAHYHQSNGRAEAAVKVAKRALRGNTGAGGSLDCDRAAQAILQYLNTPLRGVEKSPAQLATGRQLRDGVPVARQHYKVGQHWRRALKDREVQMARSQALHPAARGETPRQSPALQAGDVVLVQDPATGVWNRSGVVLEVRPYRKYAVRLSGSGRVSIRNRRHLKVSTTPIPHTEADSTPPPASSPAPTRPARQRKQPAWMTGYVQ